MARKKFKQLPRRRKINIRRRAQNANLSTRQIQKNYNKKVRKANKDSWNRNALRPKTSGAGVLKPGVKSSGISDVFKQPNNRGRNALRPNFFQAPSGTGVLMPGKKSSGISDVFKRDTKWGGWHAPMSGAPEGRPLKPGEPTSPSLEPPVAEPPTTKELVGDLVGEGTYGINQSMNNFDFERFLSRIPQENYEDQQMQDPKFTGVRTDISGSSAGGVRRRRSKRSQLGINAMGTGQLKRRPRYKLTLGGLNI